MTMYPEKMTSRERVALMNRWSAQLSGYVALGTFLMNTFGLVADRWKGREVYSERIPDNVVAETVDAVIAECERSTMKVSDFSYVIGYQYTSRTKTAFHNYTVEQVRTLVPRIRRLWEEATDEELADALEAQRNDELLAHFLHIDEGIPMDYARSVTG